MESKGFSFCLLCVFVTINLCNGSRLSYFDQTPVKSIKGRDGDVIDCVDASNQPAFDHPLLKNHDVQKGSSNSDSVNKLKMQSWQLDGSCPEGTITIRRTTQEDRIRANSINSFRVSKNHGSSSSFQANSDSKPHGFFQYATVRVEGGEYYGAKAVMNVWAPDVRLNDVSASQVWVLGGSDSDLNAIVVGWHILPELYGDNRTRFYTYWTRDNYKSTGCYNLLCEGFVQISNKFALGAPFHLLSNTNALEIEFSVVIFKGKNGWLLQLDDFILGYWPYSIFTSLKNEATLIEWGGFVFNSQIDGKQSTPTQMGSGHFPKEGLKKASYMRQLQVVDENLKLRSLESPQPLATQPNCYDVTLANNKLWGDFILYGGPGRNPNCP
ncbi:OLC1v1001745C1 [Oldenlandia corymbosa var. corymbosa]|uniref:OLC1v1001745C1 n=1 Tax=Oldenlandia corymbosa var. corymbosa TaxID=529605 RepID=A0AAV1D610_OLDCO|nr:OLC1v1001745C1 [Oldenlandia corymbosa var. corymbosa]